MMNLVSWVLVLWLVHAVVAWLWLWVLAVAVGARECPVWPRVQLRPGPRLDIELLCRFDPMCVRVFRGGVSCCVFTIGSDIFEIASYCVVVCHVIGCGYLVVIDVYVSGDCARLPAAVVKSL